MSEFKVGDVVRLKSGGPLMTIAGKQADTGDWVMVWFAQEELKTDVLSSNVLATYSPPHPRRAA